MASSKFGDIMTNAEAYNLLRNVNEDQLFYASKQHSKFLDLLTHLSRYSNLMLTMVGPAGSGKTHIKNRFLANLDSGVVVSKMHGDNVSDIKDLSARISQTFNLENHALSTVSTLISEFRQNIEAFTEDGKSCLILIDNAEKLTDASLQLLLELANTHEDAQRPHIVLIGREELAQRLQSSPHKTLFEPVGHLLELSPFTEEETARYMEYRMRSVGIKVFPFNDNDFEDIYQASQGWAGRINDALLNYFKGSKANKVLPNNKLTSVKRQSKNKTSKNNKTSYIFPLLSAGVFILLALLMYFFSGTQKNPLDKKDEDSREATILGQKIKSASSTDSLEDLDKSPLVKKSSNFEEQNPEENKKDARGIFEKNKNKHNLEPSIPTEPKAPVALSPDVKFPQTQNPDQSSQNEELIQKTSDEKIDEKSSEKIDQTEGHKTGEPAEDSQAEVDPAFTNIEAGKDTPPKVIDLTDVEPQPVEAEKPKTEPETEKPKEVKKPSEKKLPPKPVVPETVKQVETTVVKQKNEYNREEWLMKQARYKYTLQFFGSHTEKNVIGFIENQPRNIRKDFVYYETILNSKPWFVVVSGVYANRNEAVKAINKLPISLQKMEPWAHSFGGVQDDLKGR